MAKLFKLAISRSLVLLLGFLFVWEQSSGLATGEKKNTATLKSANLFAQQPSFNSSILSIHLPFEPIPTPYELCVYNENEPEEDFSHEVHSFVSDCTLESFFNLSIGINCFFTVTDHVQGPSEVPLFVLHHSWKSFLI